MRRFVVLAGFVLPAVLAAAPQSAAQMNVLEHARQLHREVPLVDGHNDYPWALRQLDPGRDLEKANIADAVTA